MIAAEARELTLRNRMRSPDIHGGGGKAGLWTRSRLPVRGSETVNIGNVARANAGRKRERRKFRCVGLDDCSTSDVRLHQCMDAAAAAAVRMKPRLVEPGAI